MTTTPPVPEERYDIIAALPGTSLYSVYSAVERDGGDAVEIREPRIRALEDVSTVGPFRALMERHQNVRHAHLSRLLDITSNGDGFWMAYEPVRGEQLRGWLTRGLQLDEALQLIAQTASGLQALHDAGLTHGDVNSRNLCVTPTTGAQLRNAGLCELSAGMGALQSSLQIPMPAYMAPEVLRGGEPGPKSDIFALGLVLYEMLTGRLPFTGTTRDTIRVKQQEGRIAPVTELNPSLPTVLDGVTARAIAWEPDERFSSVQEMRETVLEISANLSAPETQIIVPGEAARQNILEDIARFEPIRIDAESDAAGGFRVCGECLTVNFARVTRCAVCWRDMRDSTVRSRTEGDEFVQQTQKRRKTRRWIRRGSLVTIVVLLAALFMYDRGAPPGLLTGPPTTTLTAQAGTGLWTTPRGGAANSGAFLGADAVPQGVERWQADIGSAVKSSPTIADGRIFATTLDARIIALSVEDGAMLWEKKAPGPLDVAPVVADDRLFVAYRNSTLVSLDAATGEQIWSTPISNPLFSWVIVDDGSVYVSCQDGVIQAFDAGTGEKRWEIDTGGGMSAPPSISEGLLVIPTQDRQLLVLSGETGQMRLGYVVRGVVEGSAAISHGTAVVGGLDRHVRAIDIRDQNLPLEKTFLRWWTQFFIWGMAPFPPAQSGVIWTHNVGEEIRAHAAISNSRAYFASTAGNVYAYSILSGQETWKTPLATEPIAPGSPTLVNDVLFIAAENGTLYALDGVRGDRLWELPLSGPTSAAPAYADGILYLLTDTGILHAIE